MNKDKQNTEKFIEQSKGKKYFGKKNKKNKINTEEKIKNKTGKKQERNSESDVKKSKNSSTISPVSIKILKEIEKIKKIFEENISLKYDEIVKLANLSPKLKEENKEISMIVFPKQGNSVTFRTGLPRVGHFILSICPPFHFWNGLTG